MNEGFKVVIDFIPNQNTQGGLLRRSERRMDVAHIEADGVVLDASRLFNESRELLDEDCRNLIAGKTTASAIARKWKDQHEEDAAETGYNIFLFDEINLLNLSDTEAMLIACNVRNHRCAWEYAAMLIGLLYLLSENSYYQQIYDIQSETGLAFDPLMSGQDDDLTELYSRNDQLENLANSLSKVYHDQLFDVYAKALIDGDLQIHKAELDDIEDNAGFAVSRQAHTETTIDVVEAQAKVYERYQVKKYKYLTEHDDKVCPVCQALDQKIFLVKYKNPGENYPPMHPNCRCQTVPYLTVDDLNYFKSQAERMPYAPLTVPKGMTYDDWLRAWGIYLTEIMEV